METVLFYLFGSIALLAAISVITQRRVFYSAISLIICLLAISGLYMLLDSPFIAAVQVIVYAGAIMVLFLFVIMLLDPFSNAILKDKKKSLAPVGVLLGLCVIGVLYQLLRAYDLARVPRNPSGIHEGTGNISHLGEILFKEYLLPFEVTSVLILIGIIGVVVLAKRRT